MSPTALRRVLAITLCLTAWQDLPRQVFRSGIDLVTVDVLVLDRDGKPIPDLKASDFTVSAGRQRRAVKAATFVPIVSPRVSPATADPDPPESASSNVGLEEGRSLLVVVDVGQIDAGQGRGAMNAIGEFVATLGPRDRVGVVAFPSGRPRVDLTTNRAAVTDALASTVGMSESRRSQGAALGQDMTPGEAVAIDRGDQQVIDAWRARHKLLPCLAESRCIDDAQRIARPYVAAERLHSRNLFDALRGLAAAMAPLPGLKSIVLVSEGMVSDRETVDDMRRFADAAAGARVTLYSLALDIPQLLASDDIRAPEAPNRSLEASFRMDGMADAAHAAGGDVFMVSGRPTGALNRIDTELGGYYLLSFESDPSDETGKRRSIDVKVTRSGARVRARQDFVIPVEPAAASPAPPADLRAKVGELLRWPVPIGEIPIDVAAFASAAAPNVAERRVALVAELPARASLAAAGFEIADETGTVVSDAFEVGPSLAHTGGRSTYLAAVQLAPGRYRVKLGVVSADGRRGSIEHPLWVKPSPPAALRLGDVIIGIEEAAGFAPIARLAPGIDRLAIRVEVQATEAAAFERAAVRLDVIPQGEAKPLTSATMAIAETATPLKRIANAGLAVGRLRPGNYILRCTLEMGGVSSERVARLISISKR